MEIRNNSRHCSKNKQLKYYFLSEMLKIKIPSEKILNVFKFCIDNNIDAREVFIFNVEKNNYTVPKAYAFLSSTILDEFHSNKNISSFNIDIEDPKNLFKNVVSLFQGESIVINPDDSLFYVRVISILKIESLYQQLQTLFNQELKLTNCIDCLNYKQAFNLSANKEIDFISKNFENFKIKDILNIDKDTLIQILNHKSFLIKNEDSFFRLIEKINQNNQNYKFMFNYIHYENLSKEILNEPIFQNLNFNSDYVKKLILMIQELKNNSNNLNNKIKNLQNEIININNEIKSLNLIVQEQQTEYIHEISYFLTQNEIKKEFQKALVEYCFLKNDAKLMNEILKLKNFDYNLKYNVLFSL